MKVEIGDLTLHETGDGSSFFDHSGSIKRLVDVSSPIGAEQITTYFRGTRRTELRFSIAKPGTDADAVLAEWYAHEALIPSDAPLRFTSGTTVVEIPGNLQSLGLPRRIGKRLFFDYAFIGGNPVVTVAEEPVSTSTLYYEGIAPVAAGNTTATMGSAVRETRIKATPGAGAGAYMHIVILPTANRLSGDQAQIRLEMPASGNPTIEVRNATAAGTLLKSVAPLDDGTGAYVAQTRLLTFVYTGAAWVLWSDANQS